MTELNNEFAKTELKESSPGIPDVFVGREHELNKMHNYLHDAKEGIGNLLLINGDAGVGKSTLIHQFLKQIDEHDIIIVSQKFDKIDKYEPYAPFYRIIESLYAADVVDSSEMSPHLLDFIEHDFQNWDSQALSCLQTDSRLVKQHLSSAILRVAYDKTVVIVLTNVHMATTTIWHFLHYLSKRIIEHKILVVLELEKDDREFNRNDKPEYFEILQRMKDEELCQCISLSRLNLDEFHDYVNKVFPQSDFSEDFIPAMFKTTGGVPAIIHKSMEQLCNKSILYKENGIWFNKENFAGNLVNSYHDNNYVNVVDILSTLNDFQKTILKYAAFFEENIEHSVLASIFNFQESKVIKELLVLKDMGILIENDSGKFRFRIPSFQNSLLKQIPRKQFSELSQYMANIIDQSREFNRVQKIYLLSHFYRLSDDDLNAFKYLSEAFDKSILNFAFHEAREFFNHALQYYHEVKSNFNSTDFIFFFMKAAWLDRLVGSYELSIKHCDDALEFCRQTREDNIKFQVFIQAGLTYFRMKNWNLARKSFKTCINRKTKNLAFVQAMAHYGLGNIALELGDYKNAREHYEKALTESERAGSRAIIVKLYNNIAIIDNILGQRIQAIATYSKGIPVCKSIKDDVALAQIYNDIGMTYADENNWFEANVFYGKSLDISEVLGLIQLKSISFLNRATAYVRLDKVDEAREYNFKALCLLERLKDDLGLAEYHKVQGLIEKKSNEYDKAKKHFETALKKFHLLQNKLGKAETEFELGGLALFKGDYHIGMQWLQKAKESFHELGIKEKVATIENEILAFKTVRLNVG